MLDSLSQARLAEVLTEYEDVASGIPAPSGCDGDVDTFLAKWRAESPGSISDEFAGCVVRMWSGHRVRQLSADLIALNIALERRRLMLCNAAAWTWLTVSCVDAAAIIVGRLLESQHALRKSSDWFERLVRDIFFTVRSRKSKTLCSRDYCPNLVVGESSARVAAPRTSRETITLAVTDALVSVLESWLGFPARTKQFSAYFVVFLLQTIPNEDVLLLPEIWNAHQSVGARILGRRGTRPTSFRVSDFHPFIKALQAHPIASPDSREARLLQRISAARARCQTSLHEVSSALQSALPALPRHATTPSSSQAHRSGPAAAVDPTQVDTGSTSASPTRPIARLASAAAAARSKPLAVLPPVATPAQQGVHLLIRFLRDAMAVVRDPSSSSFTSLQRRIASDLDRFLPMREHGRSRIKVRGPGGAFHPDIIDLPGGFASCVLTRSHLFNSPLLLTLRSSSYYSSMEQWQNTLVLHGYDGTDNDTIRKSLTGVLNMSSYGQPQIQRFYKAWTDPENYSLLEEDFRTMWQEAQNTDSNNPEDKKIQFLDFLQWTQAVTEEKEKLFPLCGSLTGYLLTADFVYAGRVARPSLDEVGNVIHGMKLGSWNGLKAIGQPLAPKASCADVIGCFKSVYTAVEKAFTEEERAWMGFDAIMLEHALCKYQRVVN